MARLLLLTLLCLPSIAQTEKYPELGMTFTTPAGYARLPVRPRERYGVLAFVDRSGGAARPASLDVYLLPSGREELGGGEGFLRDILGAGDLESLRAGRRRYGYEPARFRFSTSEEGHALAGWAHIWRGPVRTYVIVGRCLQGEEEQEVPQWERSAENLRLFEPVSGDLRRKKWERYYSGRRGLVGIDRRIQARLDLIDGWTLRDSEHYIIQSHGVDGEFVDRLSSEIEAMRGEFAEICPPDAVLDQVSVVRICQDEEEYLAYGGWKGSTGYWSPVEEELVIFDARGEEDAELDGEHYTRAVLFHEAFHQYVYYATEGIAPHPWFDEGLAEYFGGARIDGWRFQGIEPNRYRLEAAQALLEAGAYPWEAVTAMDQNAFYADAGRLYPQGWSMAYFLATAPDVQHHPSWGRILPTYFRALRSAWIIERRSLAGGGTVAQAQERARARARAEAFRGVDWEEIEGAWRRYLAGLRMPTAR